MQCYKSATATTIDFDRKEAASKNELASVKEESTELANIHSQLEPLKSRRDRPEILVD